MIKRIKINGIKSLQNLELQVPGNLNVIIGRNGAGKSSVMLGNELALEGSLEGNSSLSKMLEYSPDGEIDVDYELTDGTEIHRSIFPNPKTDGNSSLSTLNGEKFRWNTMNELLSSRISMLNQSFSVINGLSPKERLQFALNNLGGLVTETSSDLKRVIKTNTEESFRVKHPKIEQKSLDVYVSILQKKLDIGKPNIIEWLSSLEENIREVRNTSNIDKLDAKKNLDAIDRIKKDLISQDYFDEYKKEIELLEKSISDYRIYSDQQAILKDKIVEIPEPVIEIDYRTPIKEEERKIEKLSKRKIELELAQERYNDKSNLKLSPIYPITEVEDVTIELKALIEKHKKHVNDVRSYEKYSLELKLNKKDKQLKKEKRELIKEKKKEENARIENAIRELVLSSHGTECPVCSGKFDKEGWLKNHIIQEVNNEYDKSTTLRRRVTIFEQEKAAINQELKEYLSVVAKEGIPYPMIKDEAILLDELKTKVLLFENNKALKLINEANEKTNKLITEKLAGLKDAKDVSMEIEKVDKDIKLSRLLIEEFRKSITAASNELSNREIAKKNNIQIREEIDAIEVKKTLLVSVDEDLLKEKKIVLEGYRKDLLAETLRKEDVKRKGTNLLNKEAVWEYFSIALKEIESLTENITNRVFDKIKGTIEKYLLPSELDADRYIIELKTWAIERKGVSNPITKLSGGENILFYSAVVAGLMDEINSEIKVMFLESSELDNENFSKILNLFERVPENIQVFLLTWPRDGVKIDPIWNIIHL